MHFILAALYTRTHLSLMLSFARIKLLRPCFTHVYALHVHKQLSICLARQSDTECSVMYIAHELHG